MNFADTLLRKALRAYEWHSPLSLGKTRLLQVVDSIMPLKGVYRSTTKFGAVMDLDLSQHVQRRIYFEGLYEKPLLDLMTAVADATSRKVFFDVGANVGHHSLYAVLRLHFERVFSFEPFPTTYRALRRNISLNLPDDVIQTCECAVSDREADFLMVSPSESNDGMNFIVGCPAADNTRPRVHSTSLDLFTLQHHIREIDMLKIDVEGAEFDVLKGAAGLLKNVRIGYIFIELCDKNLARFGANSAAVLTFMHGIHYSGFLFKRSGLKLIRADSVLPEYGECVFIPSKNLQVFTQMAGKNKIRFE